MLYEEVICQHFRMGDDSDVLRKFKVRGRFPEKARMWIVANQRFYTETYAEEAGGGCVLM